MTSLAVQLVSDSIAHCYADDGGVFNLGAPAQVNSLSGVRRIHLVTAGRIPERWCLVMEIALAAEASNADALESLFRKAAELLDLDNLKCLRPLTRRDGGVASDTQDWVRFF